MSAKNKSFDLQQFLAARTESVNRALDKFRRHFRGQRFVVRKEIVEPREIGFRLLVVAAMDRVIGALEQALG